MRAELGPGITLFTKDETEGGLLDTIGSLLQMTGEEIIAMSRTHQQDAIYYMQALREKLEPFIVDTLRKYGYLPADIYVELIHRIVRHAPNVHVGQNAVPMLDSVQRDFGEHHIGSCYSEWILKKMLKNV